MVNPNTRDYMPGTGHWECPCGLFWWSEHSPGAHFREDNHNVVCEETFVWVPGEIHER